MLMELIHSLPPLPCRDVYEVILGVIVDMLSAASFVMLSSTVVFSIFRSDRPNLSEILSNLD
jgi:hypothetical protein